MDKLISLDEKLAENENYSRLSVLSPMIIIGIYDLENFELFYEDSPNTEISIINYFCVSFFHEQNNEEFEMGYIDLIKSKIEKIESTILDKRIDPFFKHEYYEPNPFIWKYIEGRVSGIFDIMPDQTLLNIANYISERIPHFIEMIKIEIKNNP